MKEQYLTCLILIWALCVTIFYFNYGREAKVPKPYNEELANDVYRKRLSVNRNNKFFDKPITDKSSLYSKFDERPSKYHDINEKNVDKNLKSWSEKPEGYDAIAIFKKNQNASFSNTNFDTDKPVHSSESDKDKDSSQIIHRSKFNYTTGKGDNRLGEKSNQWKPTNKQQDNSVLNIQTVTTTSLLGSQKDDQPAVLQKSIESFITEKADDRQHGKENRINGNRQQDVGSDTQIIKAYDNSDEQSKQFKNRLQDAGSDTQPTKAYDNSDEQSKQFKNRQQNVGSDTQTTEAYGNSDEKSRQRQHDVGSDTQTTKAYDNSDEQSKQFKNRQQDVGSDTQTTKAYDNNDEKSRQRQHDVGSDTQTTKAYVNNDEKSRQRQQDIGSDTQTTKAYDSNDEKSRQFENRQQVMGSDTQTTKAYDNSDEKSRQFENRQQDMGSDSQTTKAYDNNDEKSKQFKNRQQDVGSDTQTTKAYDNSDENSRQFKNGRQKVGPDTHTTNSMEVTDEKSTHLTLDRQQDVASHTQTTKDYEERDEKTNQMKHSRQNTILDIHETKLKKQIGEKSEQITTKNEKQDNSVSNIRTEKTTSLLGSNTDNNTRVVQETQGIYKTREADDKFDRKSYQTKLDRQRAKTDKLFDRGLDFKSTSAKNTDWSDTPAANSSDLLYKTLYLNQTKQHITEPMNQTTDIKNATSDSNSYSNLQTTDIKNATSDSNSYSNLQSDIKNNQNSKRTKTQNYIDEIPERKLNILLTLIKSLYRGQLKEYESSPSNQSLFDNTSTDMQQTYISQIPYIIENPHICSSNRHTGVLIFVETSLQNTEQRTAIRETWARKEIVDGLGVKVIFVLGSKQDKNKYKVDKAIDEENSYFGDIIQGDFIDSYKNLTRKGIFAFQWISEHCSNVKFIIKVDDDIFINIFTLLYHVSFYKNRSKHFLCHYRPKGTSIIQRGSEWQNKWAVNDPRFNGMKYFPVPYCFGYFVMLTGDLVPELIKQVPATPLFWIEDVYLYGLLPSKIDNVYYESISEHLSTREVDGVLCLLTNIQCKILATWASSRNAMNLLWFVTLNNAMKMFKDNKSDVFADFMPLLNKELLRLRTKYKQEKPTNLLAIFNSLGLI